MSAERPGSVGVFHSLELGVGIGLLHQPYRSIFSSEVAAGLVARFDRDLKREAVQLCVLKSTFAYLLVSQFEYPLRPEIRRSDHVHTGAIEEP